MIRSFKLLAMVTLFISQVSIAYAVTEINGIITAKRGDRLKVEFQTHETAGPKIGDEVNFSTTLGGVEDINAGSGKVIEVSDDFIWVQHSDDQNRPNLKMKAVIHATGLAKKEKITRRNHPPPLHPCDELAGDPWDDQRVGPSIKFSSIDAIQAIAACEEAARRYPAVDRFAFQLARSYTAKGQYQNALFYYKMAAIPGNYAAAQYNLGVMYSRGDGVPSNKKEALMWYLKAAGQNHISAQYNVGWAYHHGEGVSQDFTETAKWYRKAAENGHAEAQYYLGVLYEEGAGVPRDHTKAINWYKKSAGQGLHDAQNNLGLAYLDGEVVKKNYAEALMLFRKAAEQGNGNSQNNLGLMYGKGLGVEKNMQEAILWFKKAAAQGNKNAKINLKRLGIE